jgi:hypothetical protein
MSVQELRLNGGAVQVKHVDGTDIISIVVTGGMNTLSALLTRNEQHMLFLYLQERLAK